MSCITNEIITPF